MAFYIRIEAVKRAREFVEYEFSTEDKKSGKVRVDTETYEIVLLEPHPEDSQMRVFARAKRKIEQHLKNNDLPDLMVWAS